ncbi:hypothetical protein BX616_006105, partial [Lobosporangium transversale]
MLKKDDVKGGNKSAEHSIPHASGSPQDATATSIVDKLNAMNLAKDSTVTSIDADTTEGTSSLNINDFDLNDIDDPLAGFEAQRSGIKDLSLKEQLLNPTESHLESLQNLLAARIREGSGEALFEIGIEEDGAPMNLTETEYQTAFSTVRTAASAIGAEVAIMFEKNSGPSLPESTSGATGDSTDQSTGKTSYVMIRKVPKSAEELLELRVAVVGNVSTLLGVLTKGVLDDGRGKARVNLFRHKHEIDSGRTSSVGMEILGFDAKSQPVSTLVNGRNAPWDEICGKAAKVLSFIDLAGHERYLK